VKRRDFIFALTATAAAWPHAVHAQQPRRVAVLMANYAPSDREGQASFAALVDTLQKHGWSEGRNLRLDTRWDAGDAARMQASVAEVVRSAPDVIVAAANLAVGELARQTSTIPIVFTRVADPVGSGFVASIARPGGNITGFQASDAALGSKWLGVLKEAVPDLERAAVLYGSDSGGNVALLHAAQASAPTAGIDLSAIDVKASGEIERAVAAFAGQPHGGLIVVAHPYTTTQRASIIVLAARHRLPAIYPYRFFAADGGLISYGPDQIDQWRGAAGYVDRILRGEKPGELPVQAPAKYELVVNLATARALGLNIPPAFPLRADEVIE
jgi:putative tryptophan/tyrosine transport system substrate-binding protein